MQQWARTTGIEVRHELLGAAEGAKGHAAPDVFSKGREIRRYADLALPAARAKAGGHHLIENQQDAVRSEEHTSELQSRPHLVCRLLLEKKKKKNRTRLKYVC